MEFNPGNNIVKRCLQGIGMEEKGNTGEAKRLFFEAWSEATTDFEKFMAAFYVARSQESIPDRLKWYEIALQFALLVNDDSVKSAFPSLYSNIANCNESMGNPEKAEEYRELANTSKKNPADKGPFYHGTKADLEVGDLLTAGYGSNYKSDLVMNHIYFTALINGAGLAAALAKGDGQEHVYIVEPTGNFENDPNVTDKKFPGNPTRSYRTESPLKIVGEIADWIRLTPGELQQWREKLANVKGDIIN